MAERTETPIWAFAAGAAFNVIVAISLSIFDVSVALSLSMGGVTIAIAIALIVATVRNGRIFRERAERENTSLHGYSGGAR